MSYLCPMFLFFTNEITGEEAHFGEEEARHCLQVLRKNAGDSLFFTDGAGGWYEGVVATVGKRHFTAKITARQEGFGKRDFRLHIAIAPPKNMDRLEWFLEKATELGIDEITPLLTARSERPKIRVERLEKIMLSAMKQSLRAYLPRLNEMTGFAQFLRQGATGPGVARFIAHCRQEDLPHLKDNCPKGGSVTILIGPEGDFTMEEIALAEQSGYQPVGLGKARLRTETAGLAACHIVNLIND